MTEFTSEFIAEQKEIFSGEEIDSLMMTEALEHYPEALDHIERLQKRVEELEVQLKSKDIIINNQQGRLNYYATKDLLGDKNE